MTESPDSLVFNYPGNKRISFDKPVDEGAASQKRRGSSDEESGSDFRNNLSKHFREMRESVAGGIGKVQTLIDRRLACLEQQISNLKAENEVLRSQRSSGNGTQGGEQQASRNSWTDGAQKCQDGSSEKRERSSSVSFASEPSPRKRASKQPEVKCIDEVAEFDPDLSEDEGPSDWARKADEEMSRVFGSSPQPEEPAEPPSPRPPVNGVPEPREVAPVLESPRTDSPGSSGSPRSSKADSPRPLWSSRSDRQESSPQGLQRGRSSSLVSGGHRVSIGSDESGHRGPLGLQRKRTSSLSSTGQGQIKSLARARTGSVVSNPDNNRRVSFFQHAGPDSNGGRTTVGFVEELCKDDPPPPATTVGGRRMSNASESTRPRQSLGRARTFDTSADKFNTDVIGMSVISAKSFRSEIKTNFEVLPVWTAKKSQYHSRISRMSGVSMASQRDADSEGSDDVETKTNCCREWLSHKKCLTPNSPVRAVWDGISCFLVFYDMVTIPLELMEPGEFIFAALLSWVTRLFWTLDIPASFMTGFVDSEGTQELRPIKVMKRYLRTWFVFDIMMVALEWIELAWGSGGTFGFMRFGRTSRAFRIIRMVRLLRLIRIKEVLLVIAERIRSERLIIAADIVKIMVVIVSFAHVVGCGWYGIGNADGESTWVQEFNMSAVGIGERYANSMHWSLTQFSGGMDEIRPQNISERIYAVCAFLFAFLMASVLVSRLTSSMTRLHMLSNTQAQQLVALRRYLGENGITHRTALRVQKNAQHAILEQQRFMPEHKVELLHLVSEPLRMEVHFELYHQVMNQHPFFGRYSMECPHVLRKVCHLAASQAQVSVGDLIFSAGEIPLHPKMFFVNSGTLEYISMGDVASVVEQGQWVSEMVLWTLWMHRGCLTATTNCRLSILDAQQFQDIVGLFEHPDSFDPRRYAAHFVSELNKREEEITDLVVVSFPLSILKRRHSKNIEEKDKNELTKGLLSFFSLNRGKTTNLIGSLNKPTIGGSSSKRPISKSAKQKKLKKVAAVPTQGTEKDSDSDSDSS